MPLAEVLDPGFIVQRALTGTGVWVDLATVPANQTTYTDVIGNTTDIYDYQIVAVNAVGYSGVPGYFTVEAKSISNIFTVDSIPPADPSALTATLEVGPQVLLAWSDNATDEVGFAIERADNGGAFTLLTTVAANAGTGAVNYTDTTVVPGSNYAYRVAAVKDLVASGYTNTAVVNVPLPPADPSALTATLQTVPQAQVLLGWSDNATNETGFVIERADNGGAFAPLEPVKKAGIVYRSEDQGETWKAMTEYKLTGGSTQVNQTEGGYYGRIIIDPNDDKVVYCGDTNTTVSKDGGLKPCASVASATSGDVQKHNSSAQAASNCTASRAMRAACTAVALPWISRWGAARVPPRARVAERRAPQPGGLAAGVRAAHTCATSRSRNSSLPPSVACSQ